MRISGNLQNSKNEQFNLFSVVEYGLSGSGVRNLIDHNCFTTCHNCYLQILLNSLDLITSTANNAPRIQPCFYFEDQCSRQDPEFRP